MKKRFLSIESPVKFIATWAFIYVIILIIGIGVTLASTYINNKHMQDIAKYDYEFYLTTGTFNPNVAVNGAHNQIYDDHLNLIIQYPDVNTSDFTDKQLAKYYAEAKAHQSFYSIRCNLLAEHKIAVFTVYPLSNGGLFLFYREPPFVAKTIHILAIMAAILVAMMGFFIYVLLYMAHKNQKMQRDYVDNITHELKSPIASVKALTETMYDGLIHDEEKKQRYYKIILNEMTGLETTVSSMLELSKIQNGQIDCSKSFISSYRVFDRIIEKYAALCDEQDMDFRIVPEINSGVMLYTNQSLAARILDILMDNAVKFADSKKGALLLRFEESEKMVTVTVWNNGSEISQEDQKLVFSRFYKGDKSHNEKGSGLGLAIAQEIANSLGEKLWIKSSDSTGTAFSFTIHRD